MTAISFISAVPGTHYMSTNGADHCRHVVDFCSDNIMNTIQTAELFPDDADALIDFYSEKVIEYGLASVIDYPIAR